KEQLRSHFRQRRQSLTQNQQRAAAQAVTTHALALPQWDSVHRVALYAASDGEIDTTALAQHCFAKGVEVFLPVVGDDKQMLFAQWQHDDVLSRNRYGIAEPAIQSAQQPLSNMDLIFMPLVAWDKKGNRLGMGGGYYDRALAQLPNQTLIGLAHQMQEAEALTAQPWDIALDIVITDEGVWYCDEP
ncbi:UNVERIFIED_CONTAM: hypothetical protein GTU68_058266, partial [Idotea baltica]|nr:hypothetical protein [Idotea baltica]